MFEINENKIAMMLRRMEKILVNMGRLFSFMRVMVQLDETAYKVKLLIVHDADEAADGTALELLRRVVCVRFPVTLDQPFIPPARHLMKDADYFDGRLGQAFFKVGEIGLGYAQGLGEFRLAHFKVGACRPDAFRQLFFIFIRSNHAGPSRFIIWVYFNI